jgi:hypothetical protein
MHRLWCAPNTQEDYNDNYVHVKKYQDLIYHGDTISSDEYDKNMNNENNAKKPPAFVEFFICGEEKRTPGKIREKAMKLENTNNQDEGCFNTISKDNNPITSNDTKRKKCIKLLPNNTSTMNKMEILSTLTKRDQMIAKKRQEAIAKARSDNLSRHTPSALPGYTMWYRKRK